MKILMILIIALSVSSMLFCQSSIVYDSGITIDIGTGADVSADNITVNGTFSGGGTFNNGGPLPVELVSFTASIVNNRIELDWQTTTEVNNYGFFVERFSKSSMINDTLSYAEVWQTLGFVNGSGNSNSPKQYNYMDETPPATILTYRLKQIDTDGSSEYYKIKAEVNASSITSVNDNYSPKEFVLFQNYPNPFNPTTTIQYQIPKQSFVKLSVFDILGSEIKILVNEQKSQGNYQIVFNAEELTSGIYLYSINTGVFIQSRKFTLVK